MRIAIFGGSFDPPHIGHEAIINEACKSLDVDKIFVVPTFLNPFKKSSLIDAQQRLELIHKLFEDEPKVEVCEYEVHQNRAVNTIETVEYLKTHTNAQKIYLIIGADNFKSITTWTAYEQLEQEVEFVVAKRHCVALDLKAVKVLDIDINISSTALRQELKLDYIPKKIENDVKIIWQIKKAQ